MILEYSNVSINVLSSVWCQNTNVYVCFGKTFYTYVDCLARESYLGGGGGLGPLGRGLNFGVELYRLLPPGSQTKYQY